MRQLRREAEKRGLDPNIWFGNVEHIASERIGRETVTYVSNIYKYYIAYKLAHRSAAEASGGERRDQEVQMEPAHCLHGDPCLRCRAHGAVIRVQIDLEAPGGEKLDMAGKKVPPC